MDSKKTLINNPFYSYSIYIDLPDYIADSILNDICLEVEILDERRVSTENGKVYIVMFVKFPKKYEKRFKRFLDILRYSMWLYNNDSYLSDCKEIYEDEKNAEMFSGRAWN